MFLRWNCTKGNNSGHKKFFIIDVINVIYNVLIFVNML